MGLNKDALRVEVRRRLASLAPGRKEQASKAAAALLKRQALWQKAATILFYAPLAGEVDLWLLAQDALRAGKQVFLPRHKRSEDGDRRGHYRVCEITNFDTQLETGRFGVREPVSACQEWAAKRLDFILVPGVAFDLRGRRLGRGKGYYDQLLAEVRGKTCGVAFDEQIVPEIPVEPHDKPVDCILTPTRWLEL